jgi:hypothetical protein
VLSIGSPGKIDRQHQSPSDRQLSGWALTSVKGKNVDGTPIVKKRMNIPKWEAINRVNFLSHIDDSHKGFAILTGKLSNVTAIDCDTTESYSLLTTDYPELQETFTIKTARGYHIYVQYEAGIKSNSNSFSSYRNVDIRNDKGILFAPPSSYTNCATKKVEKYEIVDRSKTLKPFPAQLKKDLKQSSWAKTTKSPKNTKKADSSVNTSAQPKKPKEVQCDPIDPVATDNRLRMQNVWLSQHRSTPKYAEKRPTI